MNWEVRTMLSRTSCFNKTLFRKNLARFWPLWGMASFGGSLFPLALLLNIMQRSEFAEELNALEWGGLYYEVLTYGVPIISLIYAILCAMVVWSYLYNHRSVSLMHTLPIRRSGLFVTNFLSGMAMMLIPYVVVGIMCVVVSLLYGAFDLTALLVTIAGVLLESFFYFSTATLAAFITGNVFALPVLYFLLHFLAVLLDALVSNFSRGFIFGLQNSYSGAVNALSPTVYLLEKVRCDYTYEEILRHFENGKEYYDQVLVKISMENFHIIVIYALLGVVCLAIAYALYQRRRSESAGDVVSVGWIKPFFRYGISGLAALLGGLLLYELFWNSFSYSNYYEVIPMLACMFVAGTIGYFAASMLLAKSLRVFKSAWRGLLAVLAGCVAVCCVLHFDVFGVTTYVPAIEDVEQVDFQAADNYYVFYPGREDELLEQVRALHLAIASDADYIRSMEDWWDGAMPAGGTGSSESQTTSTYIRFVYYLKNGRTVARRYNVPLQRARLAEEGTYDYALDTLINGEAMKLKRLHVTDETYVLNGGSLYVDKRSKGFELSTREAQAVMRAIRQDAAEGTWGTYDWFVNSDAGDYAMDLDLKFQYPDGENKDVFHHDYIYIRIKPGMRYTVSALLELNLVEESELVTYAELYPDRYDYVDWSTNAYMREETSVVIGATDSPTAIVVSG